MKSGLRRKKLLLKRFLPLKEANFIAATEAVWVNFGPWYLS